MRSVVVSLGGVLFFTGGGRFGVEECNAQSVGIFSSIPAFWWQKYPDNPIQYDRPRTFQQLGLPVRSMMTPEEYQGRFGGVKALVMDEVQGDAQTLENAHASLGGGGGDPAPGCIVSDWLKEDGCWNRRWQYLPITLRATIVAVAPGSVFKGWTYYLEHNQHGLPHANEAKQFVVLDEVITIQDVKRHNYDHGFFFKPIQHRPYPSTWPENFLTPVNYTEGEWFFRYELIGQPTDAPVGFQFCIWQDNFKREVCAPFWDAVLHGAPPESTKGLAPAKPFTPQGCVDAWQQCVNTMCCTTKGFVCKQLNQHYAQCRPADEQCPPDDQEWSCRVLEQTAPARPPTTKQDTLGGTVATHPDTSRFWELLEASGMSQVLIDNEAEMTIFAPSNTALNAVLNQGHLPQLIGSNGKKLNALLLQHIVSGIHKSEDLTKMTEEDETLKSPSLIKPYLGIPFKFLQDGEMLTFATQSEEELWYQSHPHFAPPAKVEDTSPKLVKVSLDKATGLPKGVSQVNAKIVSSNHGASNGVMHIIDSVFVGDMTEGDIAPTVPPSVNRMAECAGEYQSCLDERCCQNSQFACLAKDQYWAQCRPALDPCPPPEDPSFSCDVIPYHIEDMFTDEVEVTTATPEAELDLSDTEPSSSDDDTDGISPASKKKDSDEGMTTSKISRGEDTLLPSVERRAPNDASVGDTTPTPPSTTKVETIPEGASKDVTKDDADSAKTKPRDSLSKVRKGKNPSSSSDAADADDSRSYSYSEYKARMASTPSPSFSHYGTDGEEGLLEKESRLRAEERRQKRKEREFDPSTFVWPFRRLFARAIM